MKSKWSGSHEVILPATHVRSPREPVVYQPACLHGKTIGAKKIGRDQRRAERRGVA